MPQRIPRATVAAYDRAGRRLRALGGRPDRAVRAPLSLGAAGDDWLLCDADGRVLAGYPSLEAALRAATRRNNDRALAIAAADGARIDAAAPRQGTPG